MPLINVTKPFQWSPDGKEVKSYDEGPHDVPERCAVVAVEQLKVAKPLSDAEKKKLDSEAKAEAGSTEEQPPSQAAKPSTKK